jgi:hypothetical protein
MLRLLFLTSLLLPGCTFSTNPVFTEQDNVFDESLIGTWSEDLFSDTGTFKVTRWEPGDNSYRAVLLNKANVKQGTCRIYLSQIDKTRFMTCKFEKQDSENATTEKLNGTTRYLTFAIDHVEGEQLKTRQLRGDWLAMQVKGNPKVLNHEWNARPGAPGKQDLLITAPTPELRAFVLAQLNNQDAWTPVTFKRIR